MYYFCFDLKITTMKTIDSINFQGKRALIRVDFNVPLNAEFQITDDTRMQAAVPTIKKILSDGGSIVLMSHLGRPKEGPVDKYSLNHIVKHLSDITAANVLFANDCISEDSYNKSSNLKAGEILLLENLRFYKEEEKGEEAFAEKLAKHGDVYVNDAFGTAHRAHASTTIVAKFFPNAKVFGYVMANELKNAEKVMNHADRPFTAIMGGAKVSDKILLIEKLLDTVNSIIIGGGMAYTFAKAMGGSIGGSLVEEDKLPLALQLIEKAKVKGVNLALPVDSIIADAFNNDANISIANNDSIPDGWMGLDIGENSIKTFKEIIGNSKTILWNGPMGVFEMSNFENGTKQIALAVVEATKNGAFSLIGGGDSAAAVAKFNLTDDVSYVSTGGGALLEYMEGKVLPGVAAINLNN
jgi:phosphoglycerate kinase